MALSKSPTSEYVERFAALMEEQLGRNRHKGDRPGWLKCAPGDLLLRLYEEVEELRDAVARQSPPKDIAREAADVGNFAMMVADVLGGLVGDVVTDRQRRCWACRAPMQWVELVNGQFAWRCPNGHDKAPARGGAQ